jgi:indole-3-glycerol phosphate synthase
MAETILQTILETKRKELSALLARESLDSLAAAAGRAEPAKDFFAALASPGDAPVRLIAEIKKASPSAGVIRADFDPVALAETYAAAGADALSILTDESYFQGSLDFLIAVRQAVDLPLLRKDFIIHPAQVYQARAAGADAILLIAAALGDKDLAELMCLAGSLGMAVLLEIHDQAELDRWQGTIHPRVVRDGPAGLRWLLGINNRDLRTFTVDLDTTLSLRPLCSDRAVVVSESGIRSHDDIRRLAGANIAAVLVGETFMRADDVGQAVTELLYGKDA